MLMILLDLPKELMVALLVCKTGRSGTRPFSPVF